MMIPTRAKWMRKGLIGALVLFQVSCSNLPSDPCGCYDKLAGVVMAAENLEDTMQMFRPETKSTYKQHLATFFRKLESADVMYNHCEKIYASNGRCQEKEEPQNMSMWDSGEYLYTSRWAERSDFYKKTYTGDWEIDSIVNCLELAPLFDSISSEHWFRFNDEGEISDSGEFFPRIFSGSPDSAVGYSQTLEDYLKREQYGTWPIQNGQYWK